MKILATVVTYFPDERLLVNNVNAFIDAVEGVLIIDNTPSGMKFNHHLFSTKVQYKRNSENSISKALNLGWTYAKENGYDYLLTMDQDSLWINFNDYVKTILDINMKCIFAPQIIPGKAYEKSLTQLEWTITSGMLVPVDVINEVGGYNEIFRIDGIDMDFCLKARKKGIPLFVLKDCLLKQNYGDPSKKQILGKSITCSNYPSNRIYEIYFSHMYILRNDSVSRSGKIRIIRTCFLEIPFKVLLYENDKINKWKSMVLGGIKGFFHCL